MKVNIKKFAAILTAQYKSGLKRPEILKSLDRLHKTEEAAFLAEAMALASYGSVLIALLNPRAIRFAYGERYVTAAQQIITAYVSKPEGNLDKAVNVAYELLPNIFKFQ